MKRPRAVIINESAEAAEQIKGLLEGPIKDETGLDFDVSSEQVDDPESLRINSRMLGAQVYFIHEDDNPDKRAEAKASKMASALVERGTRSGMVLTVEGRQPYKETVMDPGHSYCSGWLPKKERQGDKKRFKDREIIDKVLELREERRLVQPISMGIIGLGKLGRGCMVESALSDSISNIHIFSNFVQAGLGSYDEIIKGEEIPSRIQSRKNQKMPSLNQVEKITAHNSLEGVLAANPDVLVICTGKHNMDYNVPDRRLLNQELFKTSLPKILPVLEAVKKGEYHGLVAIQSNPNGHLIKYATDPPKKSRRQRAEGRGGMGIPRQQITSFPPDTIRFIEEIYKYLVENYPNSKTRDIRTIYLIAPGDHPQDGGVPFYETATVSDKRTGRVRPLLEMFSELANQDVQAVINERARKIGLIVANASKKYQSDYRGVPARVIECLEDIACFQQFSRYPIYSGVLSVPTQFSYEPENGRLNIRVDALHENLEELSPDKKILEALKQDKTTMRWQTRAWLREMRKTNKYPNL
jgi:hypothetical protein